jgi:AcrR family transcriptional regulator
VQEAQETRLRLVTSAADLASLEGLEGVSIGRLARETGMSKSGVVRHFETKEELQLQTVAATERFREAAWETVAQQPPGRRRLVAACTSWMTYLAGDVFPGGCFLTAAATEFDGRPGPVRAAVAAALATWLGALERDARIAVDAGELAPDTDPRALVYELNALALAANQARQLFDDDEAPARSLRLMLARIGHPTASARP